MVSGHIIQDTPYGDVSTYISSPKKQGGEATSELLPNRYTIY